MQMAAEKKQGKILRKMLKDDEKFCASNEIIHAKMCS